METPFSRWMQRKAASVEELAEVEGMNYPTAQRIYDFFRLDLPEKREVLK